MPGNTSHYVLVGFAIPVDQWKSCDQQIEAVKSKYKLEGEEIHTAWILRNYLAQSKIKDIESLSHQQRRSQVRAYRTSELLRLQRKSNKKQYYLTKKLYLKTNSYIHLTLQERRAFIKDIADLVSKWSFTRLFAECIDKIHFDPDRSTQSIEEQAFEQVVSRFEQYLQILSKNKDFNHGILIHDNNQTVAKKLTILMKKFHENGTLWTKLKHIIETPLFVNSELTGMVQIADLCSYALRRYLENGEDELFDLVFMRADRKDERVVGIRHFSKLQCSCKMWRNAFLS